MRDVEVCILAGGLSTRMGRDKSCLRLGRRTLLGDVRANARELGVPVRVLRRDIVPRCGPVGGIYSALKTTRKSAIVFLACDMPFVSGRLLERLVAKFDGHRAVFAMAKGLPGFPLVLPRGALPVVEALISTRSPSLRNLAIALKARLVRVPADKVFNVNTPEELVLARNRQVSAQDQLVKRR
jgi:molybdopterin-guanine dinucleotide biosynthesis protein A